MSKNTRNGLGILLIAGITSVALEAWLVMLILGALHSQWESWPALGYGMTVVCVLGSNFVINMLRKIFKD